MSLKESSDELNPTVLMPTDAPPDAIPKPKPVRSALDYAALALATWGVGYFPFAPGTLGSLVGLALFLLLPSFAFQLLATLVITVLGIWAASRTERLLRVKDPGKVVVDEVAGQMVALLPIAFLIGPPRFVKLAIIVSFTLFRLFDIFKPYPARKFESLHGGLGIMADDLVAGVYAAAGTALLIEFVF